MTAAFSFELSELPPSTNALWRVSREGRCYASEKYAAWKASAMLELVAQRPGKLSGPYTLTLRFVRPDRRRRDLDNYAKPVSDALVGARLLDDDHLAQRITLEWASDGPAVWGQVISTKEIT